LGQSPQDHQSLEFKAPSRRSSLIISNPNVKREHALWRTENDKVLRGPACTVSPVNLPDVMHLSPDLILILLVLAAFIAGFIDAIAGGGGLITVPALLLSGMPPVVALGTNKLQSIFGSGSATIAFAAKGHIDIGRQLWPFLLSASGSALGAWVATQVSSDFLRAFLPYLMIAIALYFFFKPNISDEDRLARITPLVFTATLIPAIGFYDGIFGPGTGSFFMLGFVALAGFGLLKATAHTKLLNFASNIGAFIVFATWGVVDWKTGLLMGVAQFGGSRLGAQFAMKNGSKIIRPLLVTVCFCLAARLIFT
jgi:uncharacterized membrane protein YfcA